MTNITVGDLIDIVESGDINGVLNRAMPVRIATKDQGPMEVADVVVYDGALLITEKKDFSCEIDRVCQF